jgi:hypothetical protein
LFRNPFAPLLRAFGTDSPYHRQQLKFSFSFLLIFNLSLSIFTLIN